MAFTSARELARTIACRVGLDVDGVLGDLLTPLLAIASDLLQRDVVVSHLQSWALDDLFVGDEARLLPELWRRAGSPGFCRSITPYPGAAEGVAALREAGASLFVVTSPLHDAPTWTHEREEWLKEHFGIDRRHVVHAHEKYVFHGGMLVDDKPENIERWMVEHVGGAILWRQPWNEAHVFRDPGRVRRTNDWTQVLAEFKTGVAVWAPRGLDT
jgi:5'(3')-deoxyribonucleotidase